MTTISTVPMAIGLTKLHPQDFSFTSLPGVILLDGTRYYNLSEEYRLKTRGIINYYSFKPSDGTYHFRKHNEGIATVYDGESTMITGAGDVWFTTETPKREGPPSIIAARKDILEMTAEQWWMGAEPFGGIPDNLVWDMHLVLQARGREGGGRGKTKREPLATWTRDEEFGYNFLRVVSTNRHMISLHKEEHTYVEDKGPYYEDISLPDMKLWVAGRSFIFTDEDLLKSAQKLGIVGALPVQTIDLSRESEHYEFISEIERWMFDNLPEDYVHENYGKVRRILEGRG